jgi:hypothetical protein
MTESERKSRNAVQEASRNAVQEASRNAVQQALDRRDNGGKTGH